MLLSGRASVEGFTYCIKVAPSQALSIRGVKGVMLSIRNKASSFSVIVGGVHRVIVSCRLAREYIGFENFLLHKCDAHEL